MYGAEGPHNAPAISACGDFSSEDAVGLSSSHDHLHVEEATITAVKQEPEEILDTLTRESLCSEDYSGVSTTPLPLEGEEDRACAVKEEVDFLSAASTCGAGYLEDAVCLHSSPEFPEKGETASLRVKEEPEEILDTLTRESLCSEDYSGVSTTPLPLEGEEDRACAVKEEVDSLSAASTCGDGYLEDAVCLHSSPQFPEKGETASLRVKEGKSSQTDGNGSSSRGMPESSCWNEPSIPRPLDLHRRAASDLQLMGKSVRSRWLPQSRGWSVPASTREDTWTSQEVDSLSAASTCGDGYLEDAVSLHSSPEFPEEGETASLRVKEEPDELSPAPGMEDEGETSEAFDSMSFLPVLLEGQRRDGSLHVIEVPDEILPTPSGGAFPSEDCNKVYCSQPDLEGHNKSCVVKQDADDVPEWSSDCGGSHSLSSSQERSDQECLDEQTLENVIGKDFKAKKLPFGDLLVKVTSAKQSTALLALNEVREYKVSVTPHRSLNSTQGVISEDDLLEIPTDEIVEGLSGRILVRQGPPKRRGVDPLRPLKASCLEVGEFPLAPLKAPGNSTSTDDLRLPSRSLASLGAVPVTPLSNRKVDAASSASTSGQGLTSPAPPGPLVPKGRGLPPRTSAPQRKPGLAAKAVDLQGSTAGSNRRAHGLRGVWEVVLPGGDGFREPGGGGGVSFECRLCVKLQQVTGEWEGRVREIEAQLKAEGEKRVGLEAQVEELTRQLNHEREQRVGLEKQAEELGEVWKAGLEERKRECDSRVERLEGVIRASESSEGRKEEVSVLAGRTTSLQAGVPGGRESGLLAGGLDDAGELIEPQLNGAFEQQASGSQVTGDKSQDKGAQAPGGSRVLVVGSSNVARVRRGVHNRVKGDQRVTVEVQPGKCMVDAMTAAREGVWDNREGRNLVIVHAGLNDVLKGRSQNLGKQLNVGIRKLRDVSENVHVVVCTIPEVRGQSGLTERRVVEANGVIKGMSRQLRYDVMEVNREVYEAGSRPFADGIHYSEATGYRVGDRMGRTVTAFLGGPRALGALK
ncbi:hypothetical protein ISCGN_018780 [Ixodes scapularis]